MPQGTGKKFDPISLIFGTIAGGVAGLLAAKFSYDSVVVAENAYFFDLDQKRAVIRQIEDFELRQTELAKLEEIMQIGYEEYLKKRLAEDVLFADSKIAELNAASDEQARNAIIAAQKSEAFEAAQQAAETTQQKLDAVKRVFNDERICLNTNCSDYIIP